MIGYNNIYSNEVIIIFFLIVLKCFFRYREDAIIAIHNGNDMLQYIRHKIPRYLHGKHYNDGVYTLMKSRATGLE